MKRFVYRRFSKVTFLLMLSCFLTILLYSHEYILLAYKFKLQKGDTLEMHLFVADGFNIQLERPMQTAITKKFELISNNGTDDLLSTGKNGVLPVISKKIDFIGLGLIHMERDYARIALTTTKFLEYLKEDHLENIKVPKEAANKPQRERYSRYIKSLILSGGDTSGTLYNKITGQNFEIILLKNPYKLHPGAILSAQILFMGKPLANKVITARNRIGSESSIAATSRTNASGICSFKLTRKGEWFIHATHMIPCADKTDSDWESFWTSYSFLID